MMEEATDRLKSDMTFKEFADLFSNDPRFDTVDAKDREHLFKEKIAPLKKAAKKEKR